MIHRFFVSTGLLALAVLLLVGGCSNKEEEGAKAVAKFDLLARVPADTPYVVAGSKPLPETLSKHLLQASRIKAEEDQEPMWQNLAQADLDETPRRLLQFMHALSQELEGKQTPQGLAELGLPLSGRNLLYGLGVLPVAWVQITDGDKVNALLDRVEKRAGLTSVAGQLQGQSYRRLTFGKLVGIFAQREGYLVAALLPDPQVDKLLPLALGMEKPTPSLADSGELAALSKKHGYLGYGEGYIDLVKLTEMALGEAEGINAQVLIALGARPADLSPGCRALAKALVQSAPRVALGFTRVEDHAYDFEMVWETSPGVAAWLRELAAPVPGLGAAPDAIFSLGLGLHLPKLRDGLKQFLATIAEQGKACEKVDQEALARSMQSIDMMLNPMLAGIKGFELVVEGVEVPPHGAQPESVDGRLIVAATDPRGLFGMLGMFNPQLAMVQIPTDGTPVKLPLKDLSPQAPDAWAAIQGEALGIFFGRQPPKAPKAELGASPARPGVLFSLGYNVAKVFEQLKPMLEQGLKAGNAQEVEGARALYGALERTAGVYERVQLDLAGGPAGLVLDGKVWFNPKTPSDTQ